METYSYKCSGCGEVHEGLPFSWHVPVPLEWEQISRIQRRRRGFLSGETCEIRHQNRRSLYVRGLSRCR